MRRWQERALRRVYSALGEIPGGGTGLSGSTTPRSLAVAVACSNKIRRPAMMVIEALAAGDDRATVDQCLEELDAAVEEAASI